MPGSKRKYTKHVDAAFPHNEYWLINKSWGASHAWLRQWRYRLFLHRASFQGEAEVASLTHEGCVPVTARRMLSDTWIRYTLLRRALGAPEHEKAKLQGVIFSWPVERLIEMSWSWYKPMMQERRQLQWSATGDRQDILAIDGNAKLHRRTCGTPYARTVWCEPLRKYLIRGCALAPHGSDVLCKTRAKLRDARTVQQESKVVEHRLRRALHSESGHHLEVLLEGFERRWQPACTVDEAALSKYFAGKADAIARRRRQKRLLFRAAKKAAPPHSRGREPSFMAAWSSKRPRKASACETHKEGENDVPGAVRSAGYLIAVSSSGAIVEVAEIIGAESLSQRYVFLAELATRSPGLRIIVHDDACHLRRMAEASRHDSDVAERLASMSYIVDEFHASGHVGAWCKKNCLPHLSTNAELLAGFPTSICEIVNSELSPLGHTIHHFGQWTCQLCVNEMVDVHNMKLLRRQRQALEAAQKKARCKAKGQPSV